MKTILLILFLLVTATPAWAVEPDAARALIENYVASLESGDPEEIFTAWKALADQPEVVAYMKEHHYSQYYSFRLKAIEYDLEEMRDDASGFTSSVVARPPLGTGDSGGSGGGGPSSNQDIVDSSPNQDRPSNQEMIQRRSR